MPFQNMTFNPDGSLTSDALKACSLMQIDPKTLKPITEQDLTKEGMEPHIAKVRVEHLMQKRQKKVLMIENTIRSGLLNQMLNAMDAV